MAQTDKSGASRSTIQLSTSQRPDFKHPLAAFVFDAAGALIERTEISGGKLSVPVGRGGMAVPRVVIAPADKALLAEENVSIDRLLRNGAYEPVLRPGGRLIDVVEIPGSILDLWPFCFCWVHGKVVRKGDNRPVCNARVHICEVDRIPIWIARLPDREIFRLRDDLLKALQKFPVPPLPDPGPLAGRPALRFAETPEVAALNPQPLPPREGPQAQIAMHSLLLSHSAINVRQALVANVSLIIPWLCLWPHWWWWFRCDELAVVTTDGYGHFERLIFYPCKGDHPDLYFWVEYDLGSGFETVYHPPLACNTYWNYACGSEVTIRVTDPRVPGCGEEPDLPGKQIVVLSIGPGVAVREVAASGLTNFGEPFGASLEPRVDFSRSALIGSGIPYYRWSYRRLSGPDGTTATVDAGSPAIGAWKVMNRDVYRHYKDGASFPSERMGPMPATGPSPAPAENLFRIRPVASPSGDEWVVLNESVDLATAYFDTAQLPGNPVPAGSDWSDDLAAGRYEMKLELFDSAGNLVDWTAQGIDLRITDQDAPFGTGTITTAAAPSANRIVNGAGHTLGFRMIVRVDNNRCSATINPVAGTVSPDPDCGFHLYDSPMDTAGLSFVARHPNNFAGYGFACGRGSLPAIPAASVSGKVGDAGNNGFGPSGPFGYAKDVAVSAIIGSCANAAFWERLDVSAMATNGYGTLTGYNAADNAAFALAQPCDCSPDNG